MNKTERIYKCKSSIERNRNLLQNMIKDRSSISERDIVNVSKKLDKYIVQYYKLQERDYEIV